MQDYVNRKHDDMMSGFLDRLNDQFSEGSSQDYSQYRNDPASFAKDILKETLTPDMFTLMEAVRDHPVVIAKSGNAVGKTFIAARLAIWWLLCFDECQV